MIVARSVLEESLVTGLKRNRQWTESNSVAELPRQKSLWPKSVKGPGP